MAFFHPLPEVIMTTTGVAADLKPGDFVRTVGKGDPNYRAYRVEATVGTVDNEFSVIRLGFVNATSDLGSDWLASPYYPVEYVRPTTPDPAAQAARFAANRARRADAGY